MKSLLFVLFWLNVILVPVDIVGLALTGDWTWILNVGANVFAAWFVATLNPEFVPSWVRS